MSKKPRKVILSLVAVFAATACLFPGCDDTQGVSTPTIKYGASAGRATRGGPTQEPGTSMKSGNSATLENVIAPAQSVSPVPATGDPCGDVADGTAWCASDTSLGFCSGGSSHTVDCSAFASADNQWKFDAGGFCYETPTQMNCLLCFTAPDNTVKCCDSALSICCDATTGACFFPAP